LARDFHGSIGRAVIDNKHVSSRKLLSQLVEHGRKVLLLVPGGDEDERVASEDRKSTRLNSSHLVISYAVFCLKKKNSNYCRAYRPSYSLPKLHIVIYQVCCFPSPRHARASLVAISSRTGIRFAIAPSSRTTSL